MGIYQTQNPLVKSQVHLQLSIPPFTSSIPFVLSMFTLSIHTRAFLDDEGLVLSGGYMINATGDRCHDYYDTSCYVFRFSKLSLVFAPDRRTSQILFFEFFLCMCEYPEYFQ